jgi:hypothetical protein
MSGLPDLRSSSVSTAGYEDGLGRRSVRFDREVGGMLECLQLRPQLVAFEPALRVRASEVAGLDDERFARVRDFESHAGGLAVISELVTGHRLIDILETRQAEEAAVSGIDAAFGFLLQAMPALAELHGTSITHGAVAPGRIVITANAQVVLLDSIYGAAIHRLNFSRRSLWTSFGVMAPPMPGTVAIDPCADVAQMALCALLLAAGRPLDSAAHISTLAPLIREVTELAEIRAGAAFAEGVGRFFQTTLPAEGRRPSVASEGAAVEIRRLVAHIGEDQSLNALAELVCFQPAAKLVAPAADKEAAPSPSESVDVRSTAGGASRAAVASFTPPVAVLIAREAAAEATEAARAPLAPTEPIASSPPVPAEAAVTPTNPVAPPSVPVPAPMPLTSPALEVVARVAAVPIEPPLVQPPPVRVTPLPVPVTPPPVPLTPQPPVLLTPPAGALFAPAPAFVASPAPVPNQVRPLPPTPAAPAILIRQDGPKKFSPPRHRESIAAPLPAAMRAPIGPLDGSNHQRSRFQWKLVAAAVLVMSVGILAGRAYLQGDPPASDNVLAPVTAEAPEPEVLTGSLTIESQPSGARVALDGKEVGVTPLRLDTVAAGKHQVSVTSGSARVQRTVRVDAGAHAAVSLPVFSGWVAVFAPIRLDVSEGSRNLGTTESGRIILSPGRHVLTLTNSEFGFSVRQTVDIHPGEERVINLRPTGRVNLNAAPWAEVWIDGARAGETPLANLEVPLGTREFVFKHPQYGERRLTATITTSASALTVDFGRPPSIP